jgi:hypothetical protein
LQDHLKTQERKAHPTDNNYRATNCRQRAKRSDDFNLPHFESPQFRFVLSPHPILQVKAQTEAGQISRGAVAASQHREVLEGSVLPEKKGQCE